MSPDPVPAPQGWRELLRHRRFVFFLATLSVGDIGYSVYAVAAPWLAYEVTHNLLDVGAVLAAEFGLYALSFIAAPFVDRAPEKRSVLLWGFTLQAVAASAIGVLALTGRLDLPLLLGLVATISLVWDFTWSANNTIPALLLPRESLFRANGLSGLLSGGNQVTGFTVGGALILFTGAGGAMLLYGALNALAAVLSLGVSTRGTPSAKGSVWQTMVEGWKQWWGGEDHRPLKPLSLLVGLQGIFAPGAVLLITEIASATVSGPQFTYGVLFTSFVLGGAAIGILLGHVNPRKSVGRWLVATPLLSAVLLLLTPLVTGSFVVGVALWFAIGATMLGFEVCYIVYLQASSSPNAVARNTSNVFFFRGSARAAGSLVLGSLATVMLPSRFAPLLAVGFFGVSLVGLLLWGALRRLEF